MTADQRLDQLEPLFAQSLATLDQHTAQNERHTAQLKIVIAAVAQQSENISFLLREQAAMKGDIVEMKGDIAELKSSVASIKTKQDSMDDKLDKVLGLLGNRDN